MSRKKLGQLDGALKKTTSNFFCGIEVSDPVSVSFVCAVGGGIAAHFHRRWDHGWLPWCGQAGLVCPFVTVMGSSGGCCAFEWLGQAKKIPKTTWSLSMFQKIVGLGCLTWIWGIVTPVLVFFEIVLCLFISQDPSLARSCFDYFEATVKDYIYIRCKWVPTSLPKYFLGCQRLFEHNCSMK